MSCALARAQKREEAQKLLEEAEVLVGAKEKNPERKRALRDISEALAKNKKYKRLLHLVQGLWLQANQREQAIELLPIAYGLIVRKPDLGIAFYKAFAWVDDFMIPSNSMRQDVKKHALWSRFATLFQKREEIRQ